MTSRTVRGAGVDLVVDLPPGDEPVVLLAHGVGSTSRFVRESFEAPFRRAGWRLATYDLRGHGASTPLPDPVDHVLDRHLDDLDAVVTATGAEVVGGVSLGGHVATAWAADRRMIRAAIACLPAWTGRAVPGVGPHAAVAGQVRDLGIDGMLAAFARDREMEPWLREVLLRDWPVHDPDSLAAALTALDGALAPTESELRDLGCPLGLVAWPDDPGHPLDTAAEWAAWAPRSELVEIALADLDATPEPMGSAAVTALNALGVTPT